MLNPLALIGNIGLILIGLAGLLHIVIFYFESVVWSQPKTWKRFGLRSQEDADVVKPMALNQGFYNLFLAIGVFVGLGLLVSGATDAGITLTLFAALSMVAAATVLVVSNPKLARAAITQGALPLVGSILVLVALAR